MALFDSIRLGASGASGTYEVERSLRFNHHDNAYLTYIPSSDGNRQKWTWSGWVKRVRLGSTTYGLFTSQNDGDGGGNNGVSSIYFGGDDKIHVYYDTTGSNHSGAINNNRYRDTHAWYHIVWQVDAANSTSKIFVNGVSQTVNVQPVSGYNYTMNQAGKRMTYGIEAWDLNSPASIYVAECHFSDGQLYDADVFAETDTKTGQWVPKASPAITYGTNGHYLNFSDNSNNTAATIGKDYSGQGNNFTPTNISVSAGTGNDSLTDTPTNNFCVISRLDSWRSSTEVEDGSLKFRRHANNFGPARGSFAVKTGKWYFEFTKGSGLVQAGFVNTDHNLNYNSGDVGLNSSGSNPCGIAYDSRGYWYGYTGSNPSGISNGDIIGVAFDADNFKFYFHKDGTYYGSGNPSTGANGIQPNASNTVTKTDDMMFAPYFNGENGNGYANFGQRPFVHTIPTGYQSLCSANLPEPTILLPNKHFATFTYIGTGSYGTDYTFTDSDVDFTPDWVWIKGRAVSQQYTLTDSVRGAAKQLASNSGDAETTNAHRVNSFVQGGFTSGTDGITNWPSRSFVAWNWNAGGYTVTNTDGSLSAQVRANTTAGFSIGTFTAQSSGAATVGHGLGVKPDVVITKSRTLASNWYSYHQAIGQNGWILLDSNAAATTGNSAAWGTAPTSSVFTYGSGLVNQGDLVFYAFREVLGFSRFGQYVGNGNSDGVFVNLGFKPAYILLKRISASAAWVVHDSKRSGANPDNDYLHPDNVQGESDGSGGTLDILSNGFKLRMTAGTHNSGTFIYLAFAEAPFRNARAR